MKILIIEDNMAISDRLVEFLQQCDSTAVVEHSAAGLRNRIRKEKGFNLVVLDLLLGPEESIEQALKNIEEIRACYPFVPILIFTEHAQKEWIDQVKNVGVTDLLRKPPKITRDYFWNVFLPKIQDVAHRNITFDLREVWEKLRNLSEDSLINQIVIPLFRLMGYNNLAPIPHHGPGEFGMDILPFYEIDKLTRRHSYFAAQVKAGDINAKAGSNGHVRLVMDQAALAFEKKFTDDNNLSRKIDRLLIICSGKVTPDAQATLNDWLEDNTRVSIMDGYQLINRLFERKLINLLDTMTHPLAIDILTCRLDTYGKKVASWEQLLEIISHEILDVEKHVADEVYKEILTRERQFATVIGDGFALPHIYNTPLKRHKVLLCVTDEAHDWEVSEPRRVSCAVLCLFADRGKETLLVRSSVNAIIGESIASKSRDAMDDMAWLEITQATLQDTLSKEGFDVNTFPVRKLRIDNISSKRVNK